MSTEKKPTLPSTELMLSSVADIQIKTKALMSRVVTANQPLSRLKDNPGVEQWVREGIPLHRGKEKCQFCDQPLPTDLHANLAKHFSVDYEDLMAGLKQLEEDIQSAKKEEVALAYKGDLYAQLSERYSSEQQLLQELMDARRQALSTLEQSVGTKRTQAFTNVECPQIDDPTVRIEAGVQRINEIIAEHNRKRAANQRRSDQKRLGRLTCARCCVCARAELQRCYARR